MGEGGTHSAGPPGPHLLASHGVWDTSGITSTLCWATSLATVTLQQQVEDFMSTAEVSALSPRERRDEEISSARNSPSGSWMSMQALETPQIPGGWNQDSPGAHLSQGVEEEPPGFGGVEDDEEMKAVSVVGHHKQHQGNETWEGRNTGGIWG